jgi:hypothetical protein
MDDDTPPGSQLADDGLDDVSQQSRFALRVIGTTSADQVLESHRVEHTERGRVVGWSAVRQAYERLESGSRDRGPGWTVGEPHAGEGGRGPEHLIEAWQRIEAPNRRQRFGPNRCNGHEPVDQVE